MRAPGAQRGQFLVGVIAFLACLMIVIQAMVYFTDKETKWTHKERGSETAFYLAETGVNRAVWKMRESDSTFSDWLSGGPPAGYKNDLDYTDVPGGTYRVHVTTYCTNIYNYPGTAAGSLPNWTSTITVAGMGRESGGKEYRTVVATYYLNTSSATACPGMNGPSMTYGTNLRVFWGAINANGDLSISGLNSQMFPRKYATGKITFNTAPYRIGDASAQGYTGACGATQTDSLSWWACDSSHVTSQPNIDLTYYKNQAQGTGTYYAVTTTVSGRVDATPKVYFFETGANATFSGQTYITGTIIAQGNLNFTSLSTAAANSYSVTPPSTAWQEYQKNTPSTGVGCGGGGGFSAADDGNYSNNASGEGDKACTDQYPGDAGLHTVSNYVIGCGRDKVAPFNSGNCSGAGPLGGAGSGIYLYFDGFLYMPTNGTTFNGAGSAAMSMHGLIQVGTGVTIGNSSTIQFFYDPSVVPVVTAGTSSCGTSSSSWSGAPTTWKELATKSF